MTFRSHGHRPPFGRLNGAIIDNDTCWCVIIHRSSSGQQCVIPSKLTYFPSILPKCYDPYMTLKDNVSRVLCVHYVHSGSIHSHCVIFPMINGHNYEKSAIPFLVPPELPLSNFPMSFEGQGEIKKKDEI